MKPYQLFFLLVPLFLTACGLTAQQQADYASVHRAHVSPAIYDKMMHGDDLSVSDIEALSRADVNPAVILRYIRDHDTVYFLRSSDVIALHKAGVDPSVVDYMLQSSRQDYGPYPYGGYGYGYGFDPFWYPGFYGGFGYGYGYGGGWDHHHR